MSKKPEKSEPKVLDNKLLTNLVSSAFEKIYQFESEHSGIKKQLTEVASVFQAQSAAIEALRSEFDLTEQILRELIKQQEKQIFVLRARCSLLEGLVKGSISSFEEKPEKPRAEKPEIFKAKKPFEK